LRVKAARIVGIFDANREDAVLEILHAYKIVFLCEDLGGEPGSSDETSAAGFFGRDAIPPLSGARTSPRHLQAAFSHYDDPLRQPEFD
jgi:hypothetical protein